MLNEFNETLGQYNKKWRILIDTRNDKRFFESLKPTALGWKVADRAEYDKLCDALHDQTDKIIETWMNERWIAKLHLRDIKLEGGIEIIKVMQRRPDSDDALGLDHLDFYSPQVAQAETIFKQEPNLKWSWESNDIIQGYDWISLWFDGAEAKLKSDTVLDAIIAELKDMNAKIISTDKTNGSA